MRRREKSVDFQPDISQFRSCFCLDERRVEQNVSDPIMETIMEMMMMMMMTVMVQMMLCLS